MKPKSLFFAFSPFIISQVTTGHGLIEHPPSRNQICGVETKPHEVGNGGGLTPECAEAFETDWNGGYQFMSVLTHDYGRQVVKTTTNVCGFDSETWQGGATPWDTAMDRPTTPLSAGTQEFVWNISWGPHFDDTEEFVYYITKPDFVFDPTQPLSWDDFEDEPFCHENFVYSQPNNNPKVVPRLDLVKFYTYCDVPARSGRHVIYGEWGRNYFTFERFHGCVDVIFDGPANPQTPVPVPPSPTDMPIIPTMAPVPSGGAVPTAVPASGGNPTGYCNWNNCNGIEEGGSYCNQDESYCGQCGGTWCPNGSSPTSPPLQLFPGDRVTVTGTTVMELSKAASIAMKVRSAASVAVATYRGAPPANQPRLLTQ